MFAKLLAFSFFAAAAATTARAEDPTPPADPGPVVATPPADPGAPASADPKASDPAAAAAPAAGAATTAAAATGAATTTPAATATAPAAGAKAGGDKRATELPRESSIDQALHEVFEGSAFGGYGEITLNVPSNSDPVVDVRRFVLFFGHNFGEHLRMYSELEVEHAITSADDEGEVEVEQAYLDGLFSKALNVRGGLVLMPVGIINVNHEPPSFNGVDRPDVDQFVIPSTWREPGVGVFGEITEGLRYQAFLVNGFNANGFTAESALKEGHQEGQLAFAGDGGLVARLDYEPILGTAFGLSAYGATSGNSLTKDVGRVPVGLVEVDARTRWGGLTARGELALLAIGDAQNLNRALAAGDEEQKAAGPVSAQSRGGYLELGYDVLRLVAPESDQAVTVFGRVDYADTQADVPKGFTAKPEFTRVSGVLGATWSPVPQVAIKADVRHRFNDPNDPGYNEAAAAITWMF